MLSEERKEELNCLLDNSIDCAIDQEYITEKSSYREIEDNLYEILELGCEDVDELTTEESDYIDERLKELYS